MNTQRRFTAVFMSKTGDQKLSETIYTETLASAKRRATKEFGVKGNWIQNDGFTWVKFGESGTLYLNNHSPNPGE